MIYLGNYQSQQGADKIQGYQNYRQSRGDGERGQGRGGSRGSYHNGDQRQQRSFNNRSQNNGNEGYQVSMDEAGYAGQSGGSPNNGRQSSSYHPYRR